MSLPKTPLPVKLVIGLFMKDKALLLPVTQTLVKRFGPVDMISEWLAFDFTSYYACEMGEPLFRRMVVFKELVEPASLADIKLFTNSIEGQYAKNEKRQINIDPGNIMLERFVLATGKNFTHRIYIGKGIYADLTLIYQNKAFQKLPWTYPDYWTPSMRTFLTAVRRKYAWDLGPLKQRMFTARTFPES